jgi:hypothetical protein
MNPIFLTAIPKILDLGSSLIESKDKKEEYAFEMSKMLLNIVSEVNAQQTNPFIDGFVKLLTSLTMLWRPLASIGVFFIAIINPELLEKLHALGTVGDVAIGTMFGSAPAWGYSRHKEKIEKIKKQHPLDDSGF